MNKNIIAIFVILAILGYSLYTQYRSNAQDTSPTNTDAPLENLEIGLDEGQLAPDFELLDVTGQAVKLSDFRGQIVMINFWGTWCPPCRVEMPHIQKFYEDYQDSGVVVLAVNATSTEASPEKVSTFITQFQLTFPVVLDSQGEVMDTYRVLAFPTTYFVDSRGVMQGKFAGTITYDTLKQKIASIR